MKLIIQSIIFLEIYKYLYFLIGYKLLVYMHSKKESMKSKLTIVSYSNEFRNELLIDLMSGQ